MDNFPSYQELSKSCAERKIMQGCGWDAVTARCKQLFGPKKKKILKNFSDKRLCAAPPIKNKKKERNPFTHRKLFFLS